MEYQASHSRFRKTELTLRFFFPVRKRHSFVPVKNYWSPKKYFDPYRRRHCDSFSWTIQINTEPRTWRLLVPSKGGVVRSQLFVWTLKHLRNFVDHKNETFCQCRREVLDLPSPFSQFRLSLVGWKQCDAVKSWLMRHYLVRFQQKMNDDFTRLHNQIYDFISSRNSMRLS